MRVLAQQLRATVRRMREAHFSRERAGVIQEAIPLMERAADALEARKPVSINAPIDADVAKLIGALGKGSVFPGRAFYINRPKDFDAAAQSLIAKFHFEELVGQ